MARLADRIQHLAGLLAESGGPLAIGGDLSVLGDRQLNKTQPGAAHYGDAFRTVLGPDGRVGHAYGDGGQTVWLPPELALRARQRLAGSSGLADRLRGM